MNNYLKGYLASIPRTEYDGIITFLRNSLTEKLNISKEQFELIMSQITVDRQPAVQNRAILYNEKPSDTYNDFFGKVYIDLSYLFKVINLLYNAVDGYSSLSASHMSDIKGEIDKLAIMVNELKAREEYGNNSIVVTETFKDTGSFEIYNDSTSYLFCDRNGQFMEAVDLVHNNTNDMITLKVKANTDLLHGSDGEPRGKIYVNDYRGIPTETYAVSTNAIDNSKLSYWDCSVYSDEQINIDMDGYGMGGAYIKFTVRLPKVCDITEVSLTPYCIHPVEVCDVIVGDASIIDSYNVSTDTMTFCTPKVSSDEITFILKQKNYIHSAVTTNSKRDEATELWNTLFSKGKESYVSDTAKLKNEKDVYNHYIKDKENEIDMWNKNYIKGREIGK